MRRAAKVDANQSEIVKALRQCGVNVKDASSVGQGFPDLITAKAGRTVLMEVKDGAKPPSARKLTPQQVTFHNEWQGECVVVKSIDEALGVFGLKIKGEINANDLPQSSKGGMKRNGPQAAETANGPDQITNRRRV